MSTLALVASNDDRTPATELTLSELLAEVESIPDGEAADDLVGKRIKRLRQARPSTDPLQRHLSQRELAAPGVSYAYISRIEAGTRKPSHKTLEMLALKLGTYPRYLARGGPFNPTEAESWIFKAFDYLPRDQHRRLIALYVEIRRRNRDAGVPSWLPSDLG